MATITDFVPTGTLTFTQALERAEVLARTSLPPEAHGRIEMAMALARDCAVLQLDSGEWEVASQTTPGTVYHVNGHCVCPDATYHQALCKHRLSVYLTRRAMQLMHQPASPVEPEAMPEPWPDNDPESEPQSPPVETEVLLLPPAPAVPLPEAPASVNCHITIEGLQVQLTLRDSDEARLLQRLQAVLAQYPPTPAQSAPKEEGATPQCPTHGALKQSKKGKGYYCPNKLDDDTWCPSKGK